MDMSWMTTTELQKATRWSKLGELGMERALQACGAPEEEIRGLVSELQSTGAVDIDDSQVDWDVPEMVANWAYRVREKKVEWQLSEIGRKLDFSDAKCVFLAVLGHGAALVKSLAIGRSLDTLSSDHHSEELGQVTIFLDELNEDESLALYVNLATNKNLREFLVLRLKPQIATKRMVTTRLDNALAANTSIRIVRDALDDYHTWPDLLGYRALRNNRTVRCLHIRSGLIASEVLGVAQLLKSNATIKSLDLEAGFFESQVEDLCSSLQENAGLIKFRFKFLSPAYHWGIINLLRLFIHDGNGPKNTAITDLCLQFPGDFPLDADLLSSMIKTNKMLKKLTMLGGFVQQSEWAEKVVLALGDNEALTHLTLDEYEIPDGEPVYETLMKVLQCSNTRLEHISLRGSWPEAKEARLAEELRINKEYRGILRGQRMQIPTTGRLVLCGYEYAGKTSISKTAERIERDTTTSLFQHSRLAWAKLLQQHPKVRQFLWGKNAILELAKRTRGVDMKLVRFAKMQMSIWDFAGQIEYHVLHDYLFPNSGHSCFLYVCRTIRPPTLNNHDRRVVTDEEEMERNFLYWLRFIASNSKPLQVAPHGEARIPHVIFVLTGKDLITEEELHKSIQFAQAIVQKFKQLYKDVILLYPEVKVINAHSRKDVRELLMSSKNALMRIFEQSREYAICGDVRVKLEEWVQQYPSRPILSKDLFRKEIWELVAGDSSIDMDIVLAYLNDVGEVIFLKPLAFVVVNPRWFGVGVLGSLIDDLARREALKKNTWNGLCGSKSFKHDSRKLHHRGGFVGRQSVDDLLQISLHSVKQAGASPDQLVDLMENLELCFPQAEDDPCSSLFIPALFDEAAGEDVRESSRELEWSYPFSDPVKFVGRRLECEEKYLTFLTPGFFPRLQVVLRNFLHERFRPVTENEFFKIAKDLLRFVFNGMEVIVEYSGDKDYFVDILVRSSRSYEEILQFIKENIVRKIIEFCASPQGCQGVDLVEGVIRPICVKGPFSCADRIPHTILVSELENAMRENDHTYLHVWSTAIEGIRGDDSALSLLEGEGGSYEKFVAANQIAPARDSSSSSAAAEQDLPKHFYPTIEDLEFLTKLNAKANLGKVMPMKLHIMCDGLGFKGIHPHKVPRQRGRTLKLNQSSMFGSRDYPILKYALGVALAGVKVAAAPFHLSEEVAAIETLVKETLTSGSESSQVDLTVEKLCEIMSSDATKLVEVKTEKILELLQKYLEMDSSHSWLPNFLNLQDSGRFSADFGLNKVNIISTNEVVWLCNKHYGEVLRSKEGKSVPW